MKFIRVPTNYDYVTDGHRFENEVLYDIMSLS